MPNHDNTILAIRAHLTPDLLTKKWQLNSPNPQEGHCYIAAEALWHMGPRGEGYKPYVMRVPMERFEGDTEWGTHWFLKKADHILDPTRGQFDEEPEYGRAKCCGFLTRDPSRRARILMDRVSNEYL